MSILGTKKVQVSEMEALTVRNQNITNVFAKTVQDLRDVNFDMEVVKERKGTEAEALLAEIEMLENQQVVNGKVIDKISDFLA